MENVIFIEEKMYQKMKKLLNKKDDYFHIYELYNLIDNFKKK